MANYEYSSGGFPASPVTNDTLTMNGTSYTYDGEGWKVTGATAQEGTAILSTGETGGTKYLREDGDGTSSWQDVGGGGATSIDGLSDGVVTNSNIGLGNNVFTAPLSGYENTAVGDGALRVVAGGSGNTAFGNTALRKLVSGAGNTACGYWSGFYATGGYNTSLGYESLRGANGFSGSYNIGIGYQTGYSLTTGLHNVLLGHSAGYNLTTGGYNTFIGFQAGKLNTNAQGSVYIGYRAGYTQNSSENVMIGNDAGFNFSGSGVGNTFLGYRAGMFCGSASKNVCLGYQAGYEDTASNKLHIANNSTESLIEGNFSAKTVNINGSLSVNGTAVGGGGGGAMEFVSKTVISPGTAQIDITNIDSTYPRYMIKAYIVMGGSDNLNVRFSADNGTTFDFSPNYDSMGDGNGAYHYIGAGTRGYINRDGADTFVVTLDIENSKGIINSNAACLRTSNRTASSHTSAIISHRTMSSFNALQIRAVAGYNLESGTIVLYGIKDS